MRNRAKTVYCAVLLAGVLSVAAFAAGPAHASTETVIHDFTGADGGATFTGLIKVGNSLYGTSSNGGANGLGTVFKLHNGTMTVLHDFAGGTDGAYPRAGLTNVGKVLYGTTFLGGTGTGCTDFPSCGTVFKLDISSGAESVLYNFQGGSDGSNSYAPLLYANGQFYGVTALGGTAPHCISTYTSCGTVFSLTLSGTETVLYSFLSHHDGANPVGGLIMENGKLYGTTGYGGTACADLPVGCGTIFKLVPAGSAWNESIVYRFLGGNDGGDPYGKLIKQNGVFYGTTFYAGSTHNGIVFGVTPGGVETFVHSFLGGADGSHPYSGLTEMGGELYGTASAGGVSGCGYYYPQNDGCGTIYKLVPGGIQTLYAFTDGSDGGNPYPNNLLSDGTYLYGTTFGAGANGGGTIFQFLP